MSRRAAKQQLPASDEPSVPKATNLPARWEQLFGCPCPHRYGLIDRAVAWKEQVLEYGDVPTHILRDLRILAHQISETRRHSGSAPAGSASNLASRTKSESSKSSVTPELSPPTTLLPASSQLSQGARLVKHHGGETHVVEVTADGMLYRGETYKTLSAVAKVITGTHWNGLLFFGLRRRKTYTRKANG